MSGPLYELGRKAGSTMRRGRWIWHTLVGSERDEIEAEAEVGAELARAWIEEAPQDPDPELAAWVDAIGDALAARVRERRRRFRFGVVRGGPPNAVALPGGHVFLERSLVDLCDERRDEIAFVLAHEMAHVIRKHAIARTVRSGAITLVLGHASGGLGAGRTAAALGAASGGGALAAGRAALSRWLRGTGAELLGRAYSRSQELDADRLGARLVEAAGFDPRAPRRTLERLRDRVGDPTAGSSPLAYFATHPPFDERIRALARP